MSVYTERTLHVVPTFAIGDAVQLFTGLVADAGLPHPIPPSLATEVVDGDGLLTFTGLEASTGYVAGRFSEGSWTLLSFSTSTEPPYLQQLHEAQAAAALSAGEATIAATNATDAATSAEEAAAIQAATEQLIVEGKVKGEKGDKGEKGAQGEKGEKGDTGAQGPTSGGLIVVRLATTAALPEATAGVKTLEGTVNGALPTVDSVAPAVGDKILVKNQVEERRNGVYEATSLGSAGSKWLLTRIASLDESAEFIQGMLFQVGAGTINGGSQWEYWSAGVLVVGTNAVKIRQAWAWEELGGSEEAVGGEVRKVQVRKDRFGYVRFRGNLKLAAALGGADVNLGILPTGWRPVSAFGTPVEKFVVSFLTGAGTFKQAFVEVKANGEVHLLHNAGIEGQTVVDLDMSPINFFVGE